MSFPPAIVYQQTQWEGAASNFAVLCKINSRWQVKVGNFDPLMTTDDNASNVANTGNAVSSTKAAAIFPDFNFKSVSYLDPTTGQ
jgi:hypothetical protein